MLLRFLGVKQWQKENLLFIIISSIRFLIIKTLFTGLTLWTRCATWWARLTCWLCRTCWTFWTLLAGRTWSTGVTLSTNHFQFGCFGGSRRHESRKQQPHFNFELFLIVSFSKYEMIEILSKSRSCLQYRKFSDVKQSLKSHRDQRAPYFPQETANNLNTSEYLGPFRAISMKK